MYFVAYITKGLAPLFTKELKERLAVTSFKLDQDKERDYCFFNYKNSVKNLKKLVLADDIFAVVKKFKLTGEKPDLALIEKQISADDLLPAINIHSLLTQNSHTKIVNYFVYIKAIDSYWRNYRRLDMENSITKGIARVFPRWKCNKEKASLEFFMQQIFKEAFLILRLTKSSSNSFYINTLKAMAYVSDIKTTDNVLLDNFDNDNAFKTISNLFWSNKLTTDFNECDDENVDILLLNASDKSYVADRFNRYNNLLSKKAKVIVLSGSREIVEEIAKNHSFSVKERFGPLTLPYGKIAYFYYLTKD